MLYLTVHLYGRNGIAGEFKEYETKALKLFKKHGGEVIVAYKPVPTKNGTEIPDEIHVLKIGTQLQFDAFMHDPERVSLGAERDAVIRKTEVFLSEETIAYI